MLLRRSFTSGLALTALARTAWTAPCQPLLHSLGGYTIQNLTYQIVFLGPLFLGSLSNDKTYIENRLLLLTGDSHLNAVFQQYFNGNTVTANARMPSIVCTDPPWDQWRVRVFQEHLRQTARNLVQQFPQSPAEQANFAALFVLPPGTILSDHDHADNDPNGPNDDDDDRFDRYGNSLQSGMAAYHGHFNVDPNSKKRIYYGVSAWSDGQNGVAIPGWDPWQNVCAALYHELAEIRLNPNVGKFTSNDIGWVVPQQVNLTNPAWKVRKGSEIGDLALDWASIYRDAAFPLNVFERRMIGGVDCPMHHLWDNQHCQPWT